MWMRFIFFPLYFSITTTFAQPQARHLERITFDTHRNKLIMYGGAAMIGDKLTYFQNVYEWDESGWKEIEAIGPGGRSGAPLVYDPVNKVTLLIGGVYEGKEDYTIHFDVWSWDGAHWKLINTECPVKEPDAVYDRVNDRILVYGEVSNKTILKYDGDRNFELWEFKNNSWKKLSEDGPDVYPIVSFDTHRNRLVIFSLDDEQPIVSEWTGNQWRNFACSGPCPEKRSRHAVAYFPPEKGTFVFGGRDNKREYLNDLWKWDGKTWKRIDSQSSPSIRASARFVFAQDAILLYGGALKAGALSNEIWQWKDKGWKQLK